MKFILSLLTIGVGAAFAQLYFPWWTMTIICFLVGGLAGMRGFGSFFAGFMAIALLWGGYAFYLDSNSAGLLSGRMAPLIGKEFMAGFDGKMLLLLTAALGGLVGGLACLSGCLGRWIFK